jgi:hypothetical protein
MSDDSPAPPSGAERRLDELLGLLAGDRPAADPRLPQTVVRRARFQRAVLAPLRTVGGVVVAVGEGLQVILGLRRSDGP